VKFRLVKTVLLVEYETTQCGKQGATAVQRGGGRGEGGAGNPRLDTIIDVKDLKM
jgi:hypothetical protein